MSVPNPFGPNSAVAVPVWDISNPNPEIGGDVITGTAINNGKWLRITALADAVADLTGANLGGVITAVPIPKGVSISGSFPYIKLASGTVIADRARA